jgi:8-oxo-dGTP pyrophosphatase MutT (NUDIX family)
VKTCDHRSVGVIVNDPEGRYLLIVRAKPPSGRAPIAGHVDEHGSYPLAALAEAHEEAGLTLGGLYKVAEGHLPNICRRPPSHATHDGHHWVIYQTQVDDTAGARYSDDETRGGHWHTAEELQKLAERSVLWCAGGISDRRWNAHPGLEPVWVHWLAETGHIQVGPTALEHVRAVFTSPDPV